ncbi:transposase [Mycobacterium sp.]|uniref:transposase n=1 Tax=Mycobacterium sp. TaxID=1785 RepID=UPI00128128E8|nr:MAG: hypothetical protein F6Q13_11420 [Mycobacterium sp.]
MSTWRPTASSVPREDFRQRMACKRTTKTGQKVYAHRQAIVEPVFGATLHNAKHLLLRRFEQARAEWLLLAACHNLRKLHGTPAPPDWPGSQSADRRATSPSVSVSAG